jgi:dCMP deaminase
MPPQPLFTGTPSIRFAKLRRWVQQFRTKESITVPPEVTFNLHPVDLEFLEAIMKRHAGHTRWNQELTAQIFSRLDAHLLRPSWHEMGMMLADTWAQRSVDEKQKVGCVILSDDTHQPVGQGYNGRYAGSPDEMRASPETGQSECVHAELNALLRVRWAEGETHTLYCTHEPCPDCAVAILTVRRIVRVVYRTAYEMPGRKRGSFILNTGHVAVEAWDIE